MSNPPASPAQQYRATLRTNMVRYRSANLAQGVLLMSTGALAIVYSLVSASPTAAFLLACALIISAALQLAMLLLTRQLPYFSVQLASVASLFAVGLVLISGGQIGLSNPPLFVAVFLVIDNLSRLIFSFAIRPLTLWWLMTASSVLGLGLAAVLFQNVPDAGPSFIAVIAGINFMVTGVATSIVAWHLRS